MRKLAESETQSTTQRNQLVCKGHREQRRKRKERQGSDKRGGKTLGGDVKESV